MNECNLFAAEILDQCRRVLAGDVMSRHLEHQPDAIALYEQAGFNDAEAAIGSRLACLAEAVAADRPALFAYDVGWMRIALHTRGVPDSHLENTLAAMDRAVSDVLPERARPLVTACLQHAIDSLPSMPTSAPSHLPHGPLRTTAQRYMLAVLENRRHDAWRVLEECLGAGVSREELVRQVLMSTQAEVGRMWQQNELSIVEEHMASEVAEGCLTRLYRSQPASEPTGRRVLTTSVRGDQHRLGPRWLALSFESAGWDVVALGADLPSDELMHAVAEFDCDSVCLSSTLLHSVRAVASSVAAVRAAPTKRRVAVLVGGLPFRLVPDLWRVVGADATAADPVAAVAVASSVVS